VSIPEPELALALIGFGKVARRFIELLDERIDSLPFSWRLVAIATLRHGSLIDSAGIDARSASAQISHGGSLGSDFTHPDQDGLEVIRQVTTTLAAEARAGRLVVVETTVLDIEDGEPAIGHVQTALDAGAHVITANKGPAAFAYEALATRAAAAGREFLFEGAVMDGVPIFNLVRETLPSVRIDGFRGVINTTCQSTLAAMERGALFADAIAEMQSRGIAEADPSLDVDGWDAAAKTAALANALMGERVTPHDVTRTGIRHVSAEDLRDAVAAGRRIRLIASARRLTGRIDLRVEPELLHSDDPLIALGPDENALFLRTDLLGEIGILQRSSSLTQTAYALLTDLMTIRRRLR